MDRCSTSAVIASCAIGACLAIIGPVGEVSAQATELTRGRSVQATLAQGDTARYTFQVGAEYFVFGEVNQISLDVAVRVLGGDGAALARFDGPGRGAERFSGNLDDAGVYTIEVFAADEEEVGDYEITLHRVESVATDPKKLADQLMARLDGPDHPGGAIRVWRDGRTLFSKSYGMANLAYDIPFAADTRTNIGSTSKQFTAFAIMLQADRGLLSLDDDIRKHIPELPKFDETITVRHIITHTSGLREFLNLLAMSGRRLDHGDWIDRSELIDVVQRQPALQNVPGAEWNYNNTAFGLAAVIVERTSGQDFPEFMRENVFAPLGMNHSMVRPSIRHIVPGMSEGYTPGPDGLLQIGDLGGAIGAGSIYTTLADLQVWVENYANPRLGNAELFKEMMTSYVLNDGEETGYGYGLFIDEQRGLKRVHHGGADVAHRSMLAYYPEINAGITAQSNYAEFNSGVAFELAEAFFGDAMEPKEEKATAVAQDFDPATFDSADFDAYVGRYALDANPNFILTFSRDGDTFYTQATGQQQLEMTPTSDSSFSLIGVEAAVTFLRDEAGKVNGAELDQGGQTPHATRLDDEESPVWEPSVEDLADFEGRYFSEELETFYTIVVRDEGLVVLHRRLDDTELTAGEKDSFSAEGFSLTFERDRNDKVIGLYAESGRTRDVRFERVR